MVYLLLSYVLDTTIYFFLYKVADIQPYLQIYTPFRDNLLEYIHQKEKKKTRTTSKMKILSAQEIQEQKYATLRGGLIGAVAGFATSALMFKVLPRKYPKFNISTLPWSVKTAFWISPPTLLTVICAEESSNKYDQLKYGDSEDVARLKELRKQSTLSERFMDGLFVNKYKIITVGWAASMYGSWVLVNRDKIMNTAQKAVQARMYAQFITVALLLASVGLSMYEEKSHPNKNKMNEKRRWEKALEYAENEEREERLKTGFATNEDRISAKIFK
ncbi:Rcf2p NDAI_0K01640 [Naumovozyma dairenensis CBS 421]|uniref:HIG1 domain-containing protein n=1 Tax=Naumovozyma dairenensis (strain ATCC 10597 / BCRC 20456 / CBS 421 / NBRC 0211 / NRRL Y-12639) TaxID=1071378 RepID=G0WHU4_NAUDC|nr:hypothetical protein NDAI_0K01640 [Naumovozyma dairenensis CBS 421]CCD27355.1 hypothetical protein NDAI_0K01640 [Naumovozyma dairenensis CBS 421]